MNDSDAAFVLPDNTILVLEYDGGYFHDDDRVEQDVRKSRKVFSARPNTLLLRIRTHWAAHMPVPDEIKDRCAVLYTDKRNVVDQFNDCLSQINHDVRFNSMKGDAARIDLKKAESLCNDVYSTCDSAFNEWFEELKRLVGGRIELANAILPLPNEDFGTMNKR
jgi:hypothetical protein